MRVEANKKYRFVTKAACTKGELYSSCVMAIALDEKDKEVARYIRWFRDFSGDQKEYALSFTTPSDSVNIIIGYRINVETPAALILRARLSSLSTVMYREYEGMDEFDGIWGGSAGFFYMSCSFWAFSYIDAICKAGIVVGCGRKTVAFRKCHP